MAYSLHLEHTTHSFCNKFISRALLVRVTDGVLRYLLGERHRDGTQITRSVHSLPERRR
ncbi:hypothetical protein [Cynomolgus macaque cytomegalovirus strain Mauritius]|uniref:Uncharacterized protein n=1 Tax=Cynomolgus macaque cytomegalovirus strain Mauritius TaxID=1690255 RepID=A0A0K1H0E9_9BETA|nr:hypothetical protein [Cynomolgus macaque cytomegalovirus strain Mauritius]AXG21786.1 hypothetical protein [synthetic construct]AXG22054.1 hypothetical protein [synthetic construct]